jgi:solute:Na+ symporter, SSS family
MSGELGLISVMTLAETGFKVGFSALTLGLCFCVGVTFVGLTGLLISRLRLYGVMTIAEYYQLRYGKTVRWLGGLVMASAGVLNMGIFLAIDARFFAAMCGITDPNSIRLLMAGLLGMVLLYTLYSGMVSVLVANYIQFLVVMVGALVATVFALKAVSWQQMVDITRSQYGEAGFSPFVSPDVESHSIGSFTSFPSSELGWSFILVNVLVFFAVPVLWQPAASLGLSLADMRTGRRMYLWSGLTYLGRGTIPILWGIAALAWFAHRSASPTDAQLEPIMAMPLFFSEILPSGAKGLLVAGMFAAAMSTYNIYLLAWSSIITQDVICPLLKREPSDRVRIAINRGFIVLIGGYIFFWGLYYRPPATFFAYQQATGTIYLAGALACVAFGLYWKRANAAGAIAAIFVGAAFPLANVLFARQVETWPDWLHFLSNPWQSSLAAFVLSIAAFVAVSLATGRWIRPTPLPRPT